MNTLSASKSTYMAKMTAIGGTGIITISGSVFYSNPTLTEVSFPVCTTIKGAGFNKCTALSSIYMPNLEYIDTPLVFASTAICNSTPNTVLSIGKIAVSACSITTDYSDNNITCVAAQAFNTAIKNSVVVTLNNCTTVGTSAFASCSMSQINIPRCSAIYANAFAWCRNISEINLPNCTSIGMMAFNYCNMLERIDAPNVSIPDNMAFQNTKWEKLQFQASSYAVWNSSVLYKVSTTFSGELSNSNITYCMLNAATACASITSVNLPNCAYINQTAFSNCKSIINVQLPECSIIGASAFTKCSRIETFYAPKCTQLSMCALDGCSNITSLDLINCSTFGASALRSLYNINILSFPNFSNTNGMYPFILDCTSLSQIYFLSNKVTTTTSPNSDPFAGCTALQNIYVNSSQYSMWARIYSKYSSVLEILTSYPV